MSVIEHPIGLLSEQHHAFAERVAACIAIIINGARTRGKSPAGQNVEEEGVGKNPGQTGRSLVLRVGRRTQSGVRPVCRLNSL